MPPPRPAQNSLLAPRYFPSSVSTQNVRLVSCIVSHSPLLSLCFSLFASLSLPNSVSFFRFFRFFVPSPLPQVSIYLACVYYYMQSYTASQTAAVSSPSTCSTPLKNRVLFHVYHKLTDEQSLMT